MQGFRTRGGFSSAMLALMLAAAVPAPVLASNGLNLVGFGVESLGLGSADIAMSRDANAVNINPAGLTQIAGQRFDGGLVPFYSFGLSHTDALNGDDKIDNPFGVLSNVAYAARALRPDLVFGMGVFVSGGTGVSYETLHTAFGTEDEYSAVLGVSKLATGVGWQATDALSLGLGLNLTYSQLRQKIFPDTSDGSAGFFGLRVDGTDGVSFNARLGLQYRPTKTLTLGLSWASETEIKLEGGTLTVNYTGLDPDIGKVKYDRAEVEGFNLAEELGVGLAWQFLPRWLLAAEVTWLNWSSALDDVRLTASRPRDANAPAEVEIVQSLDHRDQYVVGLGLAYDWDDDTVLRIGVNIAPNPFPSRTLSPALNLTADHELAFGFSRRFKRGWEFGSALQYQPYKTESYDNPEQPFGPAHADYGVLALTLQLSRSW